MARRDNLRVPAIKVRQWNPAWEKVEYDEDSNRRLPQRHFYIFALNARDLRRLTGIHRRDTRGMAQRALDLGIQRGLDEERSSEIAEYVEFGYPWSTLSTQKRDSGDYSDLRKPGWLPTAIVVNILGLDDTREGASVHRSDLIEVETDDRNPISELVLPDGFADEGWRPRQESPLEVIDGQHRLWAFDAEDDAGDFELPVVAFHGLDIGWQAYLFYTINIKPKKIDTSLAYDLYPLLRSADWLERAEEHSIYRETRAQEVVEALWSYTESPWFDRIDMLGDQGRGKVTQAAWIRSLMSTMIKRASGPGVRGIGGLFGSQGPSGEPFVPWNRTQQAALLIFLWAEIARAVRETETAWASELRRIAKSTDPDPAFSGQYTLLNTDQGVRGVLAVSNDLLFSKAADLELRSWRPGRAPSSVSESALRGALEDLEKTRVAEYVRELALCLSSWDWRTSATPDLPEDERQLKARFRGGTGYREIRIALLRHIANCDGKDLADPAVATLKLLES